ncbi:hypothetical protein GLYMA_04G187366v4 [Glycine max]|nr:hypothetical protein GLYMA_04G187366v4 [Glycine max]KAH1112030.1 hypothetical protein GYH30_010395 [Glycine max]
MTAKHPGIHLWLVHVLLYGKAVEVDTNATTNDEANGILSTVIDSGKEKELDEEYVSLFRLMAVNNGDSITYVMIFLWCLTSWIEGAMICTF